MRTSNLGKNYQGSKIIFKHGQPGDCMYVIQDGLVEIINGAEAEEVHITLRGKEKFFGEMAIFKSSRIRELSAELAQIRLVQGS